MLNLQDFSVCFPRRVLLSARMTTFRGRIPSFIAVTVFYFSPTTSYGDSSKLRRSDFIWLQGTLNMVREKVCISIDLAMRHASISNVSAFGVICHINIYSLSSYYMLGCQIRSHHRQTLFPHVRWFSCWKLLRHRKGRSCRPNSHLLLV